MARPRLFSMRKLNLSAQTGIIIGYVRGEEGEEIERSTSPTADRTIPPAIIFVAVQAYAPMTVCDRYTRWRSVGSVE